MLIEIVNCLWFVAVDHDATKEARETRNIGKVTEVTRKAYKGLPIYLHSALK